MIKALINLFYPNYCFFCFKSGVAICLSCLNKKIKFENRQICHVCKKDIFLGTIHEECKELTWLDGVITLGVYDKNLGKIIRKSKYSGFKDTFTFFSYPISELINDCYKNLLKEKTIITFVPMFSGKQKRRGFNQSEVLAYEIAKKTGFRFIKLLEKSTNTDSQVGSKLFDRNLNLKNSFNTINLEKIETNATIVIVDDVYTTGATLNELAGLLKRNGFEKVLGLVIARKM